MPGTRPIAARRTSASGEASLGLRFARSTSTSRSDVAVEGVEFALPEAPVPRDPLDGFAHGLRVELAPPHAAVPATAEQACALEHPEVTGDGRWRDREGLRQLAHRRLAALEAHQDGAPRGVAEGREDGVEGRPGILNHEVNGSSPGG